MEFTINGVQYSTPLVELVRRLNTPVLILSVFEATKDLLAIENQIVNIKYNNMTIVDDFYVDFIYKDEVNNKITIVGKGK